MDGENWESEIAFWESAIKNYNLDPSTDADDQQRIKNGELLHDFRNQVVVGFFLIMATVLAAQYQVTTSQRQTEFVMHIPIGQSEIRVDYITMCLIAIYSLEIAYQIVGLLCHRYHTVLDYLAADDITGERRSSEN